MFKKLVIESNGIIMTRNIENNINYHVANNPNSKPAKRSKQMR